MALLKELFRRVKEGDFRSIDTVRDWMVKGGGPTLWNAIAICGNVQDFLADGKTPYERRFEETIFQDQWLPFGDNGSISPDFLHETTNFCPKVLAGLYTLDMH